MNKTLVIRNQNNNIIIPDDIEHISIINCKLTEFPKLPIHIKSIDFTTNKLEFIPDLSIYTQCKYITLKDNYITNDTFSLPNSLISLDLSFNLLKHYHSNIPNTLSILDLSYNHLMEYPNCLYNTNITINLTKAYNSDLIINTYNLYHTNNNLQSKNTIYDNKQNVHDTTIQNGVKESIEYILKYKTNIPFNPDYLSEMSIYFKKSWFFNLFCCKQYENVYYHIKKWTENYDTHSVLQTTFEEVLERVWLYIKHSEYKNELINILKEQMKESIELCFTGRISRLISTLSGFCDSIHIGISIYEQINNKAKIIYNKHSDNIEEYNNEIIKLLDNEYPTLSNQERQNWIMEF